MGKKNNKMKEMELDMNEELVQEDAPEEVVQKEEVQVAPAKVEFDAWWASRSSMIPAMHKKEIIKADFKGRKVPMVSSMADFDEALKKYGVKLA